MKWNKVQIMLHGDRIAEKFPMIKMGPNGIKLATGVNLTKINRVENPNYIFPQPKPYAACTPCCLCPEEYTTPYPGCCPY